MSFLENTKLLELLSVQFWFNQPTVLWLLHVNP